jgi:hypothetical protein
VLLFDGGAVSGEENLQRSTEIRLAKVGAGLVAAPVRVNGQGPFLFLLDTGGSSTMLSSHLAARLQLAPRARYAIDTIAGSTMALAGQVESLELGTQDWRRPEVLWMPLDSLQALDPRLEGVIGLDLLTQVDFLLDYPRTSIVLLPVSEADGRVGGTKTRLQRMNGRFAVAANAGRVGRGADVALVLDSGVETLVLFDSAAASPLRAAARPVDGQVEVNSHAGRRYVPLRRLPSLRIDDVLLSDVSVLDVATPAGDRIEAGLLPTRLFDRLYFAPTAGFVILNARHVAGSHGPTLLTRRN